MDTANSSKGFTLGTESLREPSTMARNRNRDVGIEQGINRIVEGTLVEGSIRSEGSIRIDGHFVGDIHTTGRLVIGLTGRVEGNVDCHDCESQGVVTGNLRVVGLLTLKESSGVHGEIRYGRMAVEAGARIEGVCKLDDMGESLELKEPAVKNLDHAGQAFQQTA